MLQAGELLQVGVGSSGTSPHPHLPHLESSVLLLSSSESSSVFFSSTSSLSSSSSKSNSKERLSLAALEWANRASGANSVYVIGMGDDEFP